jgi:LacI family transcriptional regulator
MANKYHVALLIETSRAYGRGLCQGVARFARERGDMVLFTQEQDIPKALPAWVRRWHGDGILARIHNPEIAAELKSLGVPVVDLLGRELYDGIPLMTPDPRGIAAMAVRFFLNAGFERFAFCGYPSISFSERRCEAFVERLKEEGFPCLCYRPPAGFRPDILNPEPAGDKHGLHLLRWLKSLPKPIAIFACNDVRGQRILSICAENGILVPEEVSVMGVDNDDVLCNLTNPPLSSVDPNAEEIGYRAAALLETLMSGAPLPNPMLMEIPPKELVERTSTDTVAVSDPATAKALRFIRLNAYSGGVSAHSVVDVVGISRTSLDERFKLHLGRSISDELMRVRLQRVKSLLRETELPLPKIARLSGFFTASHLCVAFRRAHKQTPGEYRKSASQQNKDS